MAKLMPGESRFYMEIPPLRWQNFRTFLRRPIRGWNGISRDIASFILASILIWVGRSGIFDLVVSILSYPVS
jgi:Fe2+ transport system protein B